MTQSKIANKAIKVARKRENLHLTASETVINEGVRALRERKSNLKKPSVKDLDFAFETLANSKAKNYRQLYLKTLSKNRILDISDKLVPSQLSIMERREREKFLEKNYTAPTFNTKDFSFVLKHFVNVADKESLKIALNNIKNEKTKGKKMKKFKNIAKFILKKFIKESYLFEDKVLKGYSEADYLMKIWGPLIELLFHKSNIIPHWGDTTPSGILQINARVRMDLRLVSIPDDDANLNDFGNGEFAKEPTIEKYYRDKRKCLVACKSIINQITSKHPYLDHRNILVPFIIVMGLQVHLCYVGLTDNKLYYTKKLRTFSFPSSVYELNPYMNDLLEGLDEFLEMCINLKSYQTNSNKPKSIDSVIGENIESPIMENTTKVVWDSENIISTNKQSH